MESLKCQSKGAVTYSLLTTSNPCSELINCKRLNQQPAPTTNNQKLIKMKTKFFLLIAITLPGLNLFSQTKTLKPLTSKTVAPVAPTPASNTVVKTEVAKPQNKPAPVPTDLQKAVVNIVVGDDGKDYDTKLSILIEDENNRMAGYYGTPTHDMFGNPTIGPISMGEYFPGDNETVPVTLTASVPTGEIKQVGSLPLSVTREAYVSDFSGNGGIVKILIAPNGHDTWKISNFSLTMYFNNDPSSPRKITWNGFTVSQDSRTKVLEFDKNFNTIQ